MPLTAPTSAASSPPPYAMSSAAASTAATSPPPHEDSDDEDKGDGTKSSSIHLSNPILPHTEVEGKRYARLQYVLEKSAIYSSILKARMDQDAENQRKASTEKQKAKSSGSAKSSNSLRRPKNKGNKRIRVDDDDDDDASGTKRQRADDGQPVQHGGDDDDEPPLFQQPALITGAKLKKYQLEGLQWMVSLDQNGISGILADEMGLGKTLQTIAFSAYLREQKHLKPFLIVCPLSVMHNWIDEYAKFAPKIPVCMYHGTPAERAELRCTVMLPPAQHSRKSSPSNKAYKAKGKGKGTKLGTNVHMKPNPPPKRITRRGESSKTTDNGFAKDDLTEDESAHEYERRALEFPVVVTTYEMIIKDRAHLAHYDWGYIVVDEGHRLKNLDCKLMQEIKKYQSAGRMILTGTPLHNNLAELWSLLNFILPEIFDDLDAFQEWFNLPNMQNAIGSERSSQIIGALHAILKPFLLRRLKSDVETNLPPKKEYVLYAPLSIQQREAYNQVLSGTMRSYLLGEAAKFPESTESEKAAQGPNNGKRRLRSQGSKGQRKVYNLDGDDDEYFEKLEKGEIDDSHQKEQEDLAKLALEHRQKAMAKQINNMKLQNTIMQLRKVCSHPFLFNWPLDQETQEPVLGEELVNASGKMMVLDRLLRELFQRKHKVLLFSQFTTMLDIIEEWATNYMGWNICRIDGSTQPLERRKEMNRFQTGGDKPKAPRLFLLSTRAGGLGINLVAADTVIFYDQDWNPQMDAQAQDRAHRIGQTKPVLIFRLVSAHTIETKIMQRATEKRQLEALVIAKGQFKKPAAAAAAGRTKPETMADMAAELLRLEGEKIEVVPSTAEGKANVLSDGDLEMLLDRSPDVFTDRGKGWTSSEKHSPAGEKPAEAPTKKTAFAVYDAPQDEGNDALAKMLGEDSDIDG